MKWEIVVAAINRPADHVRLPSQILELGNAIGICPTIADFSLRVPKGDLVAPDRGSQSHTADRC